MIIAEEIIKMFGKISGNDKKPLNKSDKPKTPEEAIHFAVKMGRDTNINDLKKKENKKNMHKKRENEENDPEKEIAGH